MVAHHAGHFKLINDIYGHLEGDKVLRQTALSIQINLKRTDIAIRFGGDEFMIVLPETSGEGALNLAERLMDEIRKSSFPSGIRVSLSMGISQSRESDSSVLDVVSRADKALYRAKESGRGRFYFFTEDVVEAEILDINFSHMVGRRSELQKIRQLLEESVTDSTRFALLTGETGVGKTRLVDEILNYCNFMKVLVVRNSASEHARHQPYDLLVEPVRQALAQLTDRELETVKRRVEPVHPATIELFPQVKASVMDDTMYFREERLRFRIFQDVALLVAAVSAMRPLTIILDDLQWISEPDLGILSFVARNTADAHVFYLCIMRRDSVDDSIYGRLCSIKSSLPLLHLDIRKLTPQEARNMILFALKDPNVPDELQSFLIAQSGGNPLFLREMITSFVSSGYISMDKSGEMIYQLPDHPIIPDSLGEVITSRLGMVNEDARDLLKIASLSSDNMPMDLLEDMIGGDSIQLARRIDSCIKADLLEEVRGGRGELGYRFTHGAVREFLAAELPDTLKLNYHKRMASYFEELYREGREELLTTVAYHYVRSHDNASAAEYALMAGRQAFSRAANKDALNWYMEFLDKAGDRLHDDGMMFEIKLNMGSLYSLTGEVTLGDENLRQALDLAGSPEQEASVHFRIGKNLHRASEYPQALASFSRAVRLVEESGASDPAVIGIAIESMIAISFINRLRADYSAAQSVLDTARALLDELGEEVREDLWALYYTRQADLVGDLDSDQEALDLYMKALTLCRKMGDIYDETVVLNNMHSIYSSSGDYGRALETLEETVKLNRTLDDRLGLAIAYFNIAEHHQMINMLQLAREYYDKYQEINSDIGNTLGVGYGNWGLGHLSLLKGDLEESEACFCRALDTFIELGCEEMIAGCRIALAQIMVKTERSSEAAELLKLLGNGPFTSGTANDILYVTALVQMSSARDGDNDALESAVRLFSESLSSGEDLNSVEIALRTMGLATALQRLGRSTESDEALRDGSAQMSGRLKAIRSYSVRNSILTRSEIAALKTMLEERGIDPPGADLSSSRD